LAETNFEHEAEKLASQFQEHQENVQNEYLITMQEMSQDIVKQLQAYQDELVALDNMIAEK
jgi:Skp family chaperone for outer membrane proteins